MASREDLSPGQDAHGAAPGLRTAYVFPPTDELPFERVLMDHQFLFNIKSDHDLMPAPERGPLLNFEDDPEDEDAVYVAYACQARIQQSGPYPV